MGNQVSPVSRRGAPEITMQVYAGLKIDCNFGQLREKNTEYICQPEERLFFLNGYPYHGITLRNCFQDIHAIYKLTEHRVPAIEVRLRSISNKKLGTIGIGASVSH